MAEFFLQCGAGLDNLSKELFVFGQEVVYIAGAGVGVARVLEVEVEATRFNLVDRDPPGLVVFLTFDVTTVFVGPAPPFALGLEFLDADGLALVVALGAGRIGVLVIPYFLGGQPFSEEEQVGSDAGVWIEDAIGQADDGVEVTFGKKRFLDAGLDPFTKESAVGQHKARAASRPKDLHDEHEEEVGGLARTKLGRKVGFDAVLLHTAKGRVGDDDVHTILRTPITQRAGKGIVVPDVGRNIDAMK